MILRAIRGLYHPKLGVVVAYVEAFHLTGCAWALGWLSVAGVQTVRRWLACATSAAVSAPVSDAARMRLLGGKPGRFRRPRRCVA